MNMIDKAIIYLKAYGIPFAIAFLLFYLVAGYISWTWLFSEWNWPARLTQIFISSFAAYSIGPAIFNQLDEYNPF
jgi:hypothetical protein